MKINYFTGSPETWNNLVSLSGKYGFWSDYNWLKFNISLGKTIELFSINSDLGEIKGCFSIEIAKRKFTKYGYVLGGVYILKDYIEYFDLNYFEAFCKSFARSKGLFIIRFDVFQNSNFEMILKNSKKLKVSYAMGLPRYFGEIKLEQSLEFLKKNVSSSSRNNINKAARLGLQVKEDISFEGISTFYNLLRETSFNKKFLIHNIYYFENQFKQLRNLNKSVRLFICYYKNIPVSAAWINVFDKTAYYTHGASTHDYELSKLRSQYYLQWSLIEIFKKEGFRVYNMWGVLPSKNTLNIRGMKGVSDFKYNMGCSVENTTRLYEYRFGIGALLNLAYDIFIYRNDRF